MGIDTIIAITILASILIAGAKQILNAGSSTSIATINDRSEFFDQSFDELGEDSYTDPFFGNEDSVYNFNDDGTSAYFFPDDE